MSKIPEYAKVEINKELRKISTLFIFIFCSTALLAQTSVCGKVLEAGSRLPLAGAVVSTETGIWCVTDTTGSFVLRFPKKKSR